jgi:two-component system NarL family response regulator
MIFCYGMNIVDLRVHTIRYPTMRQLDVLVADNHPIFAEGLQAVLSDPGKDFFFNIKGVANSGSQVADMLYKNNPDLLLLDLSLPEMDGLKQLSTVKKNHTKTRILVMAGAQAPNLIKEVYDAGADGFMLKSGTKDELLHVIHQIVEGNSFWQNIQSNRSWAQTSSQDTVFAATHNLTQREMEILRLIGKALDNHEIGAKLFISHQTVSVHRKNIMRKLGVNSTANLIKIAFENQLV